MWSTFAILIGRFSSHLTYIINISKSLGYDMPLYNKNAEHILTFLQHCKLELEVEERSWSNILVSNYRLAVSSMQVNAYVFFIKSPM